MNATILLVLTILSTSWAADVRVYDYFTYEFSRHDGARTDNALAVSPLPWKFNYELHDVVWIRIVIKNPSTNVNWNITCTADQNKGFHEMQHGQSMNDCHGYIFKSTQIKMNMDLYKSEVLCSSLLVAEGRAVSRESGEITFEQICEPMCIIEVDVSDVCADPPLTTTSEKTIEVTTVEVNRAIKNLTGHASTSPPDIIETTTSNITTNDTNATQTDNSDIVVIVPSVLGVLFVVVVVVIVVWKCCLFKRRPTVNPRLPTIPPHQPFYENIMLRDGCNIPIEEIENHVYEEIDERRSEDRPVDEVIEDCRNGPTENFYDLPDD